jgi:hypothetical protein
LATLIFKSQIENGRAIGFAGFIGIVWRFGDVYHARDSREHYVLRINPAFQAEYGKNASEKNPVLFHWYCSFAFYM